jgi:diguanylate cyclase (GGDEF)-like protein
MLDVDDFKSFNDSFGHDEGDETLRRVAALLSDCARATDVVCRYGGEEFALILPNTGLNEAIQLGDRICRSIDAAPWTRRQITVSIGAASSACGLPDIAALVRRADLALYEAKFLGKNRVAAHRMAELNPQRPVS